MELLKQELRKIWTPAILAVLLLLGGIYYFLFSNYTIEYFNNGSEAEAAFALSAAWSEQYGPTLEPSERAELDAQLARELERFAEGLKMYEEPAQYGFSDWDSFQAFREDYYRQTAENGGQADMVTEQVIWKTIGGTNHFTIQALRNIMESYDGLAQELPPNLNYEGSEERILDRVREIRASDSLHGYLPASVLESTNSYISRFAVWAILSVILLLSPTLVRDKLRRVRSLQWSSKTGRRILDVQYLAAGISALGLTLVNFAAFGIPFLRCRPLLFRDFPLFSFQTFAIPWFDWTFGRYLLIMACLVAVLAIAAAGLAVFLSRYSGNYVAMLLKALPLFAVIAFCSTRYITDQAFFIGNKACRALGIPGAELLPAGLLVLFSVLTRATSCARHRIRKG